MSGWTTAGDVRKAVERLWDRGDLLVAAWTGEGLVIPYRMPLRGPSSTQWSENFDEARRWISSLEGLPVVWKEFRHPRLGTNRVPVAVEWSSVDTLVAFVGREAEVERFRVAADLAVGRQPLLAPWIRSAPHRLLDHQSDLDRLLSVVDWMVLHPRPGVFLRQIDVPGVHTKFVEAHRGLLSEWFELVLPPDAVDATSKGVSKFAERYGFATKPRFVRFRPLDPDLPGPRDLSWRLEDWLAEGPAPHRLLIVENEITYLSLPALAQTWAVFGAGYSFEGWDRSPWLAGAELWYWGDLDTHGFAILDQLRAVAPQARSVLMDEATLVAHRAFWGREDDPTARDLPRLTEAEQQVYQGLVGDRWTPRLRLEQEHLNYQYACRKLKAVV